MIRITSSLSFVLLLALGGCFGEGPLGIFETEPLVDEYTGFDQEIRGDYAQGSPVTFRANLEEGMTGVVDIQVPEQFTVIDRGADYVSTMADGVGTGEVVIRLDGDTLGRYDTRVAATDRLEFRRVVNSASREDYETTQVFHPSVDVEVVVDFYAGDRRLFGRSITSIPTSEDWAVRTTGNNDRISLLTELAGTYEIPVTVGGVEVGSVAFERVDSVATFDLRIEGEGDLRTVHAVATDAGGRDVAVAPAWSVDGEARTGFGPLEFIGIGDTGGLVEATLDGETVSLSVPAI